MKNYERVFAAVLMSVGCSCVCLKGLPAQADGPATQKNLSNSFFPLNWEWYDPTFSSSREAQAELIEQLGYDGMGYLRPLDGLEKALSAMGRRQLKIFTAALPGYGISVDPGTQYNPGLKDGIRRLKGHGTLMIIGLHSKKYPRSSPRGDDRAVEVCRELADYAAKYGVRVAIYPHVGNWSERIEDAVRIAKKADRENLGICFNLYHWLRTDKKRDLKPLVEQALPCLFLVTINGTSPEGSMETLDRGAYDVCEFLKPFIDAGYTGPIGLQCHGIKGDARDNLKRSMNAWRKISERLTAVQKTAGSVKPKKEDQ